MLQPTTQTFTYGGREVTLETGHIARQATGAVMVRAGDTVVLVTVVGMQGGEPRDFMPLTVNYQEKTYAAGKIPGGFLKREGRPSDHETLVCRLIDRPLRPLFPKGFSQEVQVVATVMSADGENNPDILALLGASAALAISGIPFQGPVGAARVGFVDGNYVLNPSAAELENSQLDLVVAGTEAAVLMVESEADQLTEEQMLGAVMFGHKEMQAAIYAIKQLAADAGKPAWDWQPPAEKDAALVQQVLNVVEADIVAAFQEADKQKRQQAMRDLREKANTQLAAQIEAAEEAGEGLTKAFVGEVISSFEKKYVRGNIVAGKPRIDGRDTKTVRPIDICIGKLPRAHGEAIFTRGETQAIVVATLGGERDAQMLDNIRGEARDRFMLHYNFPPYCVGEAGFMTGPKRREIGHGFLAKRAISAVLPSEEEFPYVLRIVSEITESNGSSSMASVCGSSLALMDAGVPIKAPVAGIAMGLILEDDGNYAVLTDILGDEDHLGDMDFKVAGTAEGVTALQMDIKVNGITEEIMSTALAQAKEGRLHILGKMNETLPAPREEVSEHAPRMISLQVPQDKIRDVIGRGGATIREITETYGVSVDINDDGLIRISAVDAKAGKDAEEHIKNLTAEVEVGQIYTGKVVKIMEFGAFVSLLPGKDGFLHISQISNERIHDINDKLKEGQEVTVKAVEIDRQGRVRVSMKELQNEQQQEAGSDNADAEDSF